MACRRPGTINPWLSLYTSVPRNRPFTPRFTKTLLQRRCVHLNLNRTTRHKTILLHHPITSQSALCLLSRPFISKPLPGVTTRIRHVSTKPLPTTQSRIGRFLYRTLAYLGFFVLASGGIIFAFFVYDYTTYKEEPTHGDVPVPELALNPRRGGPKNLPIVECLLDDADSPEKQAQRTKPRLVVLGTGWGSIAMLKQLDPDQYHVTVISPSNYFLFTPMLPSATVGTLEPRSLIEPVRRIIRPVGAHFLKATAKDIEISEKLVEVQATGPDGENQSFYVPYDKLVMGVGQ